MPMELAPLRRLLHLERRRVGPSGQYDGRLGDRPVVAVVTGMGTALATAGVESLLDAVEVGRVVVVGITGAVDDETVIGTLVRPEVVVDGATGDEFRPEQLGDVTPTGRMWTTDGLTTDPDVVAALRADGVVALDMETAAVARLCEHRGIPWSVYRVVSDRATDGSVDDEVFHLSRQDGTPDARAVAAYLLRHPGRVPGLARMARDAKLATGRAASAAVDAVSRLPSSGP